MSEPVLVQPTGPIGHMPPWTVDSLIEDLRAEGLDARLAYEEFPGGGAVWDVVVIWVASSAGAAVINQVVGYAFKWLEDMFREHPDVPRPRAAEIMLYEGDWTELYLTIKKEAADKEPVSETPKDFEQWTRRKPVEGVYPLAHPGERVRVRALPGSEVSQQYAGRLGRVKNYPTMSPGGDYSILMDDGTEIPLRREAFNQRSKNSALQIAGEVIEVDEREKDKTGETIVRVWSRATQAEQGPAEEGPFRRDLSLRFNHSSFAMSFKYIAKLFAFAVFAGLDGLLDGRVASGWSRKAAFGASR